MKSWLKYGIAFFIIFYIISVSLFAYNVWFDNYKREGTIYRNTGPFAVADCPVKDWVTGNSQNNSCVMFFIFDFVIKSVIFGLIGLPIGIFIGLIVKKIKSKK